MGGFWCPWCRGRGPPPALPVLGEARECILLFEAGFVHQRTSSEIVGVGSLVFAALCCLLCNVEYLGDPVPPVLGRALGGMSPHWHRMAAYPTGIMGRARSGEWPAWVLLLGE